MGAKQEFADKDAFPGPGYYNDPLAFTQIKVPLAFINPDKGNGVSGPNYPGPGQYSPDDRLTYSAVPNYTISGGPEKGLIPQSQHELGPGQYIMKPLIGGDGTIAYTIGERRDVAPGTL